MTRTEKAVEAEFEVLGKEKRKNEDAFIAFVTRLMDEIFVIPGTKIRFGLDPLVSLIPGFGAWGSALVRIRPRSVPQLGSVRFIVPDHSPDTIFGR